MNPDDPLDVFVHPSSVLEERAHLLEALTKAFPVRFRAAHQVQSGPKGTLNFLASSAGRARTLRYHEDECDIAARPITFVGDVDRRLKTRMLVERRSGVRSLVREGPETAVLAELDGHPLWLRRTDSQSETDDVGAELRELNADEALRDRLTAGSFMPLVPLIEFLRALTIDRSWLPPPLRATIVIDDPNLHWPTYGAIDYRELVSEARTHNFHAAMATVPLDGWFVHPRAAQIFRDNSRWLSLAIHGNNHSRNEFSRFTSTSKAESAVQQALQRIGTLERRSGLRASRVLIPPHEAFGQHAADALGRSSFEGISVTRAYPWTGDISRPFAAPTSKLRLSGWRAADFVTDWVPAVLRRGLFEHEEIMIRSYLDLPLVIYGHVDDVLTGLEPLVDAASLINGQGDVMWMPLDELLATNFESRRVGHQMDIRPLGRSIKVEVPGSVDRLRIHDDASVDGTEFKLHSDNARFRRCSEGNFEIDRTSEVETLAVNLFRPPARRSLGQKTPVSATAVLRRALAESRDRVVFRRRKCHDQR